MFEHQYSALHLKVSLRTEEMAMRLSRAGLSNLFGPIPGSGPWGFLQARWPSCSSRVIACHHICQRHCGGIAPKPRGWMPLLHFPPPFPDPYLLPNLGKSGGIIHLLGSRSHVNTPMGQKLTTYGPHMVHEPPVGQLWPRACTYLNLTKTKTIKYIAPVIWVGLPTCFSLLSWGQTVISEIGKFCASLLKKNNKKQAAEGRNVLSGCCPTP